MLIYDSFPIESKAREFAAHILATTGREVIVCLTEEEAREHDLFPFNVTPPIVMVGRDRNDYDGEKHITEIAISVYGGEFAGT
jgi:hypothetical protein